jgi:putative hemolysin
MVVTINKILFLFLALIFISGCSKSENLVNETLKCSSDSDCVPAQCCHATSCVSQQNKQDCSGRICTMDCKPGTMDCGQGSCGCVNKQCAANIPEDNNQIANPASVFCIENGGKLEIRADSDGGQYGVCKFVNGSECEEWKYFRGEC